SVIALRESMTRQLNHKLPKYCWRSWKSSDLHRFTWNTYLHLFCSFSFTFAESDFVYPFIRYLPLLLHLFMSSSDLVRFEFQDGFPAVVSCLFLLITVSNHYAFHICFV